MNQYGKTYYHKNKEIISKKAKQRRLFPKSKEEKQLIKLNRDIRRLLVCRLKTHFSKIGFPIQSHQAEYLIGNIDEARKSIESKFRAGMSWGNKKNNWEFDHIKPLCNAKTIRDLIERSHFSNIQPLFAIENQRKNTIENFVF